MLEWYYIMDAPVETLALCNDDDAASIDSWASPMVGFIERGDGVWHWFSPQFGGSEGSMEGAMGRVVAAVYNGRN